VKLLTLKVSVPVIKFTDVAKTKPRTAPINNDGAKIPPLPPEPIVSAEATGLNNIIGEQHIFADEDMAFDAFYDMLGQSASGKYCALKKPTDLI
jgi:hypothetical protein